MGLFSHCQRCESLWNALFTVPVGLKFLVNDQLGIRKLGRLKSCHLLGILLPSVCCWMAWTHHIVRFPFGIQLNGKHVFPSNKTLWKYYISTLYSCWSTMLKEKSDLCRYFPKEKSQSAEQLPYFLCIWK